MKKAREGVRVCMLVWDDKSSLNSNIMGGSGMMATHDEDTRKFFANTGVHIHHLLRLPCISMYACTHLRHAKQNNLLMQRVCTL